MPNGNKDRHAKHQKGYTLVEIVVVLVIMSILSTIPIMSMPELSSYQSVNTADALRYDLNLTRILSMTTNQRYRLVLGTTSYQIQDQDGNPIIHPQTAQQAFIYPNNTTISPTATVIFDSQGVPYDASNLALINTFTWTITSNDATQTVTVNAQTGYIE